MSAVLKLGANFSFVDHLQVYSLARDPVFVFIVWKVFYPRGVPQCGGYEQPVQ
jgi:hypothetical protein